VELAVVVGRPLYWVDPAAALGGVFGYAAFNDLSAREHQMHSRLWTLGKNADRSGPISPIVTADEVGDPADGLRLVSRVNGEVAQDGNTADMILPVGDILAYVSEVLTLAPGDVICTGTPAGVGFKGTPPRYLGPGDVVQVEIERVGIVGNPIVESVSV
jgi:2,4-diketo-3-deoxy-L-fuconate hydrolase